MKRESILFFNKKRENYCLLVFLFMFEQVNQL